MRTVLHILTRPEEDFVREIISRHQNDPEKKTAVIDLTKGEPPYKHLLENIFAAESVQVW